MGLMMDAQYERTGLLRLQLAMTLGNTAYYDRVYCTLQRQIVLHLTQTDCITLHDMRRYNSQ